MTKPFDMAMFLSGVLAGSKVTQHCHVRQARIMQAAIQQRWQRTNPWTWQLKHIRWFLDHHLKRPLQRFPILLWTHRSIDLEAIREQSKAANHSLK